MKTVFLSILLAAFFLALPAYAGKQPASNFHDPLSEAEKALDQLLVSNTQSALLLDATGDKSIISRADANRFTKNLKDKVKAKRKKPTSGKCEEDDLYNTECNLSGFDPLTCGTQDIPASGYSFYTIKESKEEAVIMAVWHNNVAAGEPIEGPTYRLVKEGRSWKLDGVTCPDVPAAGLD